MPVIRRRDTSAWIKTVAAGYGKTVGDIAYVFCDDAKILEVNRQYLQHDYYTDIITFDYTEGDRISGDLFISLDTVRSNAAAQGTEEAGGHNRPAGATGPKCGGHSPFTQAAMAASTSGDRVSSMLPYSETLPVVQC